MTGKLRYGVLSAERSVGLILVLDTVNSEWYSGYILAPFLENVSDEKEYWFRPARWCNDHTTSNSVAVLQIIFGD
jgi:hypothetical protein